MPSHVQIQSDKILALTNAASVELEPIWATLLSKALEGKNVKELLSNVGSGGGAPAVGGAPAAAAGGAAAAEEKKEEKKEEEKEESDDDMVRYVLISYIGWVLKVDFCVNRALVSSTDHRHLSSSDFVVIAILRAVFLTLHPKYYDLSRAGP